MPAPLSRAQINAIKDYDLRTIFLAMFEEFEMLHKVTGTNSPGRPTNSPQAPAGAVPTLGSIAVTGANGAFSIVVTNPTQSVNKTLYIELSYADQVNFGSTPTVLPITTLTRQNYPAPGITKFWRARWSYDQNNWSGYYTQPSAVSSGLQTSAATENSVPLNQTNYASVDSIAVGGSANVRVYGKAGPTTQYPSVKGNVETIRPSATIINVPLSSSQVVAFDGENYVARATLPEVFSDEHVPVGVVSVVGGGAVILPTVSLVLGSGGAVLGWNVTDPGNGLTGPVTLTIVTSSGTGATAGVQTIENGKLISIAPGNPGSGYSGGDTVTVSGGVFSGVVGGGQGIGGNGGRLIVNDGTTGALAA